MLKATFSDLANIGVFAIYVVVAVILGAIIWFSLFSSEKIEDHANNTQAAQTQQQGTNEHAEGSSATPRAHSSAEQTIADYTKIVGIFTGLLVIATIFLFISGERNVDVARRTAKAAKESADVARDTLIAAQRPWVKVDGLPLITSDLVFVNGEGSIDLVFTISNRGSAPGLRVRIDAKIVASNQINLLEEQRNWAANFRVDGAPSELRPEYTSWKDDKIVYRVKAWMNSVEMPRFKPLSDNTPFPISLLAIVGCVTYEFDFAPGYHQTGIIYDLRKTTPYSPGQFGQYTAIEGAIILKDGVTIPKDHLQISIGLVGTGPVN
jgi:hypothetical protein